MVTDIYAFYMWPPFWITETGVSDRFRDPEQANDEVGRYPLDTGVVAAVRRDGLFVFDFTQRQDCVRPELPIEDDGMEAWEKRLAAMQMSVTILNAYLASFFTAQHRLATDRHISTDMYMKLRLGPSDLVEMPSISAPVADFGGPHGSSLRHAAAYVRTLIDTSNEPIDGTYTSQHHQRDDLPLIVVEDSMTRLNALLASPDALMAANLLLHSVRAVEDCDYSTALVMAWAVAEKAITTVWERHLDSLGPDVVGADAVPVVTKTRRKVLEGREYTASVIIETLSLVAAIDNQLYEDLTAARRARNRWLHELGPVDSESAERAISAAEALILKVYDAEISMTWISGMSPHVT